VNLNCYLRPLRRAFLLLLCVAMIGGVQASEGFRFFRSTLNIPERGAVASCVILIQTNRFTFLPPPEWVARVKAEEMKVLLVPRDQSASISVAFQLESGNGLRDLQAAELREQIRSRIPKGKILREFPCYTGTASGLAFDVEFLAANKTRMTTRLAWVALTGVTVEFTLTSTTKGFDEFHLALGNLLTSFNRDRRS
jgi:hypothetical protein